MGINGCQWVSMSKNVVRVRCVVGGGTGLCGWLYGVGINGYQRVSMDINGYQWVSMASEWVSTGINGYQWVSMGINVYQWLSMGINGF